MHELGDDEGRSPHDGRRQLTIRAGGDLDGGWFDGEIRDTWPAFTANRYVAPDAKGKGTREERDRLLADAEVILGGWPFPLDLRARSPKLKW
ncbi:MAG: hypothetical protein ABFS30_10205, partial [Pseudomonadota bacterium]